VTRSNFASERIYEFRGYIADFGHRGRPQSRAPKLEMQFENTR
jgi:hypothetical protein